MRQFKPEMKKIAILGSAITSFLTPVTALAEDIGITPPKQGGKNLGYSDIGAFITNFITLAFVVAIIVVLVMLIIGAYEWIVSGGDKEAVGKARNRIINALIGLAVLAVAFALARLGAQFLGFPDLSKLSVPTPP